MKYEEYITMGIIANNEYGITTVNGIESLRSLYFIKENYPGIVSLIKAGDIEAIKSLPDVNPIYREFLDIITFKEQNGKLFIATIYDSDELTQDPQVIEIYSFPPA